MISTLECYERVKTVGRGSCGSVLLMRRLFDNAPLAMKQIDLEAMSAQERDEVLREVGFLKQLDHPNIISYYDSVISDKSLSIVMEYADGGNLQRYWKRAQQEGTPFAEEDILYWTAQIAVALSTVHEKNVIHRDIKLANIMLTKDNIVKVGDFGMARVLSSQTRFAQTCCGTPYYLAPELCLERPYNEKCDCWALGCIMYELATLRRPFDGNNLPSIVMKICHQEPVLIDDVYSLEMRSLVACLLAKRPQDRPAMDEILMMPFMEPYLEKIEQKLKYATPPPRKYGQEELKKKVYAYWEIEQGKKRIAQASSLSTSLSSTTTTTSVTGPRSPVTSSIPSSPRRDNVPDHLKKRFDSARSRMSEVETSPSLSPKPHLLPSPSTQSPLRTVSPPSVPLTTSSSPSLPPSRPLWYENQGNNETFELAQQQATIVEVETGKDETVENLLNRYLNDVADKAITLHSSLDNGSSSDDEEDIDGKKKRSSIQNMLNMSTWKQANSMGMDESQRWSTAPVVCSLCRREDDMSKMIHPCSCGRPDVTHGECFLSFVSDVKNRKCAVCKKKLTPRARDGQLLDVDHPERCLIM